MTLLREGTEVFRDEGGQPYLWVSDESGRIRVVIALDGFFDHFSDAPRWTVEREHWEGIKSVVAKTAIDLFNDGKAEPDGSVVVKPEHFNADIQKAWGGTWPWPITQ